MLTKDPSLGRLIPEVPVFTFKRATSIASKLMKWVQGWSGRWKLQIKRYPYVWFLWVLQIYGYQQKKILPDGKAFIPKHFENCRTFGVIYQLRCNFGCFYVSKTKLDFWKRAYWHIRSMQTCNPDLVLGRHTTIVHQGKFPKIKFLNLDRIHPNPRGGDWNKNLLQLELRWVYMLKATHPPGLNEAVCFKPFLEGFTSGGMEK